MKKIIEFAIIMLVTICLVACGKEKADYKLVIRSTFSSYGGTTSHSSEHPSEEFDIETGKEYSYGTIKLKFEIIKINADSIVIKTVSRYSSGNDLDSIGDEFTIYFDEETTLKTYGGSDATETYYLILKK